MDDGPVRVGIVGLGHNGMAHLRAHMTSGASEIVAVYDRNRDLVEKACREFDIRKQYVDDAFYDDPDIDAVSIHTGENDHKDPFVNALRAGKHVLVEKPLANTEEDVHEMVEAATRADPGWLAAIRENHPSRTPIWDGANSTLATLVAVRAIRERNEIDVPIFGPRRDAGA